MIKLSILALVLLFSLSSVNAFAFSSIKGSIVLKGKSKDNYADLAKITLSEAAEIAQKRVSGKIIEIDLEEEDGFLVYEVKIIKRDNTKIEILVDAGNGDILKEERD